MNLMTMLYHTLSFDNSEWNYYFNMIKKDILKKGGYVNIYLFMFFTDESYISSSKYKGQQIYGTLYDNVTKEIYPIIDIKNVDKKRKKLGQKSLF